jgi:adenylate kinase
MRLLIVGPPGAGKGTQAKFLASHFSIPHISTGDIFRANIAAGTPLGLKAKAILDSGELVPDEITIGIVRERLGEDDAEGGFLLDGFPRTEPQAEALDELLAELGTPLDAVLELQVDDEEIVHRLSGRRICATCGHVWHVEFEPPEVEGVCDLDGGTLYQRDDDKPETVRNRLRVYADQTAPLIDYYTERGLLTSVRGSGAVEDIRRGLINAVERSQRSSQ